MKAIQSLQACSSAVKEIMEFDDQTVIAVGSAGEMTLLYSEEADPSGESVSFKQTHFPSLNHAVTCVARCETDPE